MASVVSSIPVYSMEGTMIEVVRTGGERAGGGGQGAQRAALDPGFLIPHRKNYYLFVLVEDGSSRHWVDFVPYTLQPMTFYFTIPEQVHLKEETRPMQGWALRFTDEFLQLDENRLLMDLPVIRNPAGAHAMTLMGDQFSFIQGVMAEMAAEYGDQRAWKNPMLGALLRVLVIFLSRLYGEQFGRGGVTPGRMLLRRFLALIDQEHARLHEVAEYAEQLYLSPGHLNEVVKEQSGRTAMAHIHERLAVEAKRRLLHTELSVKEIAEELGFGDDAYFNRFFRRMTGESAARYRALIREMYR